MPLQIVFILALFGLVTANDQQVNLAASPSQESRDFGQLLAFMSVMRPGIQRLESSIQNIESRLARVEAERQSPINPNEVKRELDQLKAEFQTIQIENSHPQTTSAELTNTVTQLSQNVASLIQESRSQFPEIRSGIWRIRSSLQDLSNRAITDIKFGPVEYSALHRGVGYHDHVPYVITEVGNFNADKYPDSVKRRKIQKLVGANWRDLGSG